MELYAGLKYPLVILAGLVTVLLITPAVIRITTALGLIDTPDTRRIHTRPIPRGGGVAIFIGFHAACALLFLALWTDPFVGQLSLEWWNATILASTLLVIVGLLDDARGLTWYTKIAGQICAALIMFNANIHVGHIQGVSLPPLINLCITTVWFLAFINACNLIDGLDGLATGLGLIAAFGLAGALIVRRQPTDALVALGLGAACLGFLRYNFNPAKIFLGDTGSMFLGFMLAAIALSTSSKGTVLSTLGVALLAIGVPIFDTCLAIWRRSVRRISGSLGQSSIVTADLEHIHHKLMHRGFTQKKVALILYLANAILVGVAISSLLFHSSASAIYLLSFLVGTYVVVRHIASVELWDSGTALIRGICRPKRSVLVAVGYPLADALLLGISYYTTVHILSNNESSPRNQWINECPLWCGCSFVGLVVVSTYSRVWSRARSSEFALLSVALTVSALLAYAVETLFLACHETNSLSKTIVYAALSSSLIVSLRVLPQLIREWMETGVSPYKSVTTPITTKRILLYGAGDRARSYLRRRADLASRHEEIVGFVDDDANLRKRLVLGFRVFGSGNELPQLIPTLAITDILLTAPLSESARSELLALCKSARIVLREWYSVETVIGATDVSSNASEPPLVDQTLRKASLHNVS
jgi:UDP-GlcNAc:undecaprenyl-phosphate GlcNAc-1-phosphate transferase